jgi:hypothetical protein
MSHLEGGDQLNFKHLQSIVSDMGTKGPTIAAKNKDGLVLVFSRHRHYRHLVIALVKAQRTQLGKLKNPLEVVDPLDFVWTASKPEELKFYSAVSRFKNHYNESKTDSDLEALKLIVANPLSLELFAHDESISANLTPASLIQVSLSMLNPQLEIFVDERKGNYAISATIKIDGKAFDIALVQVKYLYFIHIAEQLYLVQNHQMLKLIDFFKQNRNQLVLDEVAYQDFENQILTPLEEKVVVHYAYLKPANQKQIEEQGFDLPNEKIIYLSESDDFVLITPVMKYGGLEIPIISQKQIKGKDKRGKAFTLQRDEQRELQFLAEIARAHDYFKEQMGEFSAQLHTDCFYLHRQHFLAPTWFLDAFENWRSKDIVILGFNTLKDNKQSAFKAVIDIKVNSGMDWFETAIRVKFNQQTVSLKHLHQSLRSKHKFVALDDGTHGLLPEAWLRKFEAYFANADIEEEVLRTPNVSYALVQELYDEAFLSEDAQERLQLYRSQLNSFEGIETVAVPAGLNATLRDYQREGLNWLNFLDGFNFGGCLADDMGLGKTLQIIAFILTQKEKGMKPANLIVVQASLVFNWQRELAKFAPSLKVKTVYGASRATNVADFDDYDVVLTSYGTLLSDLKSLKAYRFNYLFLDEAQAIKNPDSQRYKAAKLLQARNRIVITGTPVENNTFDLYGLLSFACPGLLGNRDYFRNTYSIPIDQFKLSQRAEELHQRIKPFLLRRTKAQVAKELPEKNEMVIYCEMGERQREIYESFKTEIRDYLMGTAQDELKKSSMHVLQGITKLRQVCNSPMLISREAYFQHSSAKLDVLMEQIESKAPYHKLLVFSQFVGMLDLVKAELQARNVKFSYLTGQTKNREEAVTAFQEDEDVRVFLISLKAGGVGLNLTKAEYVYLIDPWWNPAVENQAIDRTHRIGQDKHVVAVRLICPDTIEEKMMLMQDAKKDLASDLIKTETSIFKSLNKQDLLDLL